MQAGHIVVDEVLDFATIQWQARKEQQAVGIVEGLVAGMWVGLLHRPELLVPPLIGFHGHNDVGISLAQYLQRLLALLIVLQHIHHHQAQVGLAIGACTIAYLLGGQRSVGHDAVALIERGHHQATQQRWQPVSVFQRLIPVQQHARHYHPHQHAHNLEARKIEYPNPPGRLAQQGQQGGYQCREGQQQRQAMGQREPGKRVEVGQKAGVGRWGRKAAGKDRLEQRRAKVTFTLPQRQGYAVKFRIFPHAAG